MTYLKLLYKGMVQPKALAWKVLEGVGELILDVGHWHKERCAE